MGDSIALDASVRESEKMWEMEREGRENRMLKSKQEKKRSKASGGADRQLGGNEKQKTKKKNKASLPHHYKF